MHEAYGFAVYVAKEAGSGGDVWLHSVTALDASLDFDYETLKPVSDSAREKLKNWAEYVISCGLGYLAVRTEEELRSKGLR